MSEDPKAPSERVLRPSAIASTVSRKPTVCTRPCSRTIARTRPGEAGLARKDPSARVASALAFREALDKAAAIVLEPISQVAVTVPAELQGDVLGDLHSKRARVQGTGSEDGMQTITALVPTAELSRYAVDLRAITSGRGRFRVSHDHYDVKP